MNSILGLALAALAVVVAFAYSSWHDGGYVALAKKVKTGDLDFAEGEVVEKSPYVDIHVALANSAPGVDGPPALYITVGNLYPGARALYKTYLVNDGNKYVKIEKCNFTSIAETRKKEKRLQRDVDYLKFDISFDVDLAREKKGKAPPFKLKPGEKAVVWIKVEAASGAPEEVSVEAVFVCWGK